jgi:hypothetical protein
VGRALIDTYEVIGPLAKDLPEMWECVICGVPPRKGEVFTLTGHGDDIRKVTVTVQHMYVSDCDISDE